MSSRSAIFTVLALALGLFLVPSGTGQELLHFPPEESIWDNPFPGLGNVSPGSAPPLSSRPPLMPSTVMLYADDVRSGNYSDLSPTPKSTELYLARFPSNKRTGAFQRANFNVLWAPNSGRNGVGITELDLSAMFALPLPTPDSPLLLTPKFSTTFFNAEPGWNETFHTAGLGMRWIRPIVKDKLTADIGFSVLYSGDFQVRTSDALRFPSP
jgi:hypothetical protein